jgi:pyruvate dehydrogenase E2 component (dihydrolipoyllysine-residue acetyltransferase)
MSVPVSMPQLGESVTEGTVTRWLKKEGERVEADEPLLEVSTDKVDTEIPSPASGILRSIAVDEDETVAVGAQLAVIEESDSASAPASQDGQDGQGAAAAAPQQAVPEQTAPEQHAAEPAPAAADAAAAANASAAADAAGAPEPEPEPAAAAGADSWSSQARYAPPPAAQTPGYAPPPAYGQPPDYSPPAEPQPPYAPPAAQVPAREGSVPPEPEPAAAEEYPPPTPLPGTGEAPYVTPLVRKLAAEHAVDLESVTGTGVGGRIRKQDVIEAARAQRGSHAPAAQAPAAPQQVSAAQGPAAPQQVSAAAVPQQVPRVPPAPGGPPSPAAPAGRPAVAPSSLRGTTQRMSRPRQVIAQRMVESLRVSAQLTTVVEADVTAIARLRDRAKRDFEAREGVKLSFLPFFALAVVEALKVHPKLNAVIDGAQVTYHDAEHLGVAVDTERGLMVPVIHNAGDLNLGGIARKIGDLAQRTRSGQVGPDELAGGTFTLTNTGSRGALFDTPIINQPQVAILGTGTVVKRPVVVEDPALGEVITVRSMVYLALTYDHRLVDGSDAARFLITVKNRLEEGAFESELGL